MLKVAKSAALAVVVFLCIPFGQVIAPEWNLVLVDESGRGIKGIEVRESWQQYSIEDQGQEETRTAGAQGEVIFPMRVRYSPLGWRFACCIRQVAKFVVLVSCVPSSWIVILYVTCYGNNEL